MDHPITLTHTNQQVNLTQAIPTQDHKDPLTPQLLKEHHAADHTEITTTLPIELQPLELVQVDTLTHPPHLVVCQVEPPTDITPTMSKVVAIFFTMKLKNSLLKLCSKTNINTVMDFL